MSGGGSGGGSAPSSTTANNTETVIQQVPQYEQSAMQSLLGQAATEASQPYQQFQGTEVAGFQPDQTQAFSNIENLIGSGAAANAGTAATNAATAGVNSASGITSAGDPYLQDSAMYNPAAAASPFMAASAATNTPQGISAYMSPFLQNDITGMANTAMQQWNNMTAPSINDSFISSGQAGSGRNAQVIGQQANLADQALTGQIASAENQAYSTAGNQAASAASNLSGLGSLAGTTAASEAANLQNVGTGLGNLAATQAGAQGSAATNLANTANTVQNTGIAGNAALQAVGQTQQNLAQTSINQAMTDWQNQVNYPEQQAGFLSNIIHGLPTQTATTSAGQTPATTNMAGSVSPLSSLAGTLTGAGAMASTGAKEGGLIEGYARGGTVRGYDSGGIVMPDDVDMKGVLSALLGGNDNSPVDVSGVQSIDNSQPISFQGQPAPTPSTPEPETISDHIKDGINISGNAPPDLPNLPSAPELAAKMGQGDQTVPAVSDRDLMPISSSSNASPPHEDDAPISALANAAPVNGNEGSRSTIPPADGSISSTLGLGNSGVMDEGKMRNYQLLMMAKGFLTPARSGAEALGNAVGNYGQAGMDVQKMQNEQNRNLIQMADTRAYRQAMMQNRTNNTDIKQSLADQKLSGQVPTGQLQQIAYRLQQEDSAAGRPVKSFEEYANRASMIIDGRSAAPASPSAGAAKTTANGQIAQPQKQQIVLGGSGNIDQQTGDVTAPTFGFDTSNIPPKVFNQMASEDSKRRMADVSNMPIAANVLRSLDQLEPNLSKVTTGSTFTPYVVKGAKTFNSQGDTATAAANIEKNTNDLAMELNKFQYVPGMRGSVLGLQTILASKPGLQQPEQTNKNIVNSLRSKITDYQLTGELAQQYREASPLKITDQNTYALDNALKTLYPVEQVDPKTGNVVFNKENVQKIRSLIPDAIANPGKYLNQARQGGGGRQPSVGENKTPSIPAGAIDLLKKNPGLAPQFEAKYGVKSSQYLGQ